MTAKRFLFETSTDIPATSIAPDRIDFPFSYDPFIDPGVYGLYDNEYDCSLPGLYRWKVPQELNIICRIVRGDIYETLSAFCWARTHGAEHNTLAHTGAHSASHYARVMKIRMGCGFLTNWVRAWMSEYPHRAVSVLTTEPSNGVDDGHVSLELEIDGAWRMFDLTGGTYFTENGNHIDTQRFIEMMAADIRPDMHALSPVSYNAELFQGQFCYGTYADMVWRTEEDRWAWYKRIFQSVAGIA